MKVCSLHFTESDYFKRGVGSKIKKRKLKSIAIPTQNLPVIKYELSSTQAGPSSRMKRQENRSQKKKHITENHSETVPNDFLSHTEEDFQTLLKILDHSNNPQSQEVRYKDSEIQVTMSKIETIAGIF
ncbi:hypothetical protein FQR65_LT16529 [Abscondita terminalis]|nr:hypothetical protein FQR65_LT16529 [Abscondita terminalis]